MTEEIYSELNTFAWPPSKLGEAIELLTQKSNFLSETAELSMPESPEMSDDTVIGEWIALASARLGIEAEAVESSYLEVEKMICRAGPALIRIPGRETPQFLAILKSGSFRISVITPELSVRRIRPRLIRDALTREMEVPLTEQIDPLLLEAGVPEQRRKHARASVLREQLAGDTVGGCWCLRLSPGADFRSLIRHARIPRCFLSILGMHIIAQFFMLLSWKIIGQGVFNGNIEIAWMIAWALLIFTAIPFELLEAWVGNLMSVNVGRIFKRRLLYGILQLKPGEIRHQGAGQFLGRVMESEALESLALEGGLTAIAAVIELIVAVGVLSMGTGGWTHALLLLMWMTLTALICWRYYLRTRGCTTAYREMTNDLVERMVGHRTRLAQEDHHHWHDEEDKILSDYLKLSERRDRAGIKLNAIVTNGWLLMGLSGIAYTFVIIPDSKARLAVSLGGILMASAALDHFVGGVQHIIGIKIAWEQAGQLFRAAGRSNQPAVSAVLPSALGRNLPDDKQTVLFARDLEFRYRAQGRPVLQSCNLRIYEGDRLLLEGPSGGGKSTFASLAAGLRIPDSGILLLRGLDRQTVGIDEWRRRVTSAPQFHENHVLTETFSFNLLMGRRWPPLTEDIEEAEMICRELGLGELLDRMPSGFQQMIGESGWRLSHGERSRLYIARALLQKADIIILDESFAALDPENLHRALECVLRRAPTLLVIAHP